MRIFCGVGPFKKKMSSDLQWALISKHNSFLLHSNVRNGIKLSKEPFNLRNEHNKKFSGLINNKGLDVQPTKDGKSIVLSLKVTNKTKKPLRQLHRTTLKRATRTNVKSVRNISSGYTPQYTKAALARLTRFARAQQYAAGVLRFQKKKSKAAVNVQPK